MTKKPFYTGNRNGFTGGSWEIPSYHVRIQRGDRRSGPTSLKTHKAIGFLSNTGPYTLKNHKATKLGSSSARQRNAIWMAFRWRAIDGPLLVVFGSPHQLKLKKKKKKAEKKKLKKKLKKLSGSAHARDRNGFMGGYWEITSCMLARNTGTTTPLWNTLMIKNVIRTPPLTKFSGLVDVQIKFRDLNAIWKRKFRNLFFFFLLSD